LKPFAMTIRWSFILCCTARMVAGAEVQTAGSAEKKPPPISCGSCHWGQDVLQVQDLWKPGMEATAVVAAHVEKHPQAAVESIRRSLETTDEALKKAQQILTRLETSTDIPVESLRESVQSAEEKFAKLQEATVSTDQEAIKSSAEINLALQKVWSAIERTRDERKSRLSFSILVLATVVLLLTTLAGLKHFLPEPVVLPEEEEKNRVTE